MAKKSKNIPLKFFTDLIKAIRKSGINRSMLRYFDWPLFLIVIAISLFGVVTIFSATTSNITEKPANIIEMLSTQSLYYPGYQLLWIGIGLIAIVIINIVPYDFYGEHANLLYIITVIALASTVLLTQAGRGGMKAFFNWGKDHGIQPSELGKITMIIAIAKALSVRTKPFETFRDCLMTLIYMGVPVVLIAIQPDFGTALVYVATFCVLLFVSDTRWKLIGSTLMIVAALVIPLWYFLNNSGSDSFRFMRILIWLDPESYPDEARQVINARIAIGSGGMLGKGIVSPGSFASLGFISDDHTDFIFSIVCESFGLVGGLALTAAYVLLLWRLIMLVQRVSDPFGSYLIMGIAGMLIFHILENIGMVVGLFPVTGIPLPFMSYGGSNMLTNMACIGMVQNVVMRSRMREAMHRDTLGKAARL